MGHISGQVSPRQIEQGVPDKMEKREKHMLDEHRVRLCSSLVVSEVQALKTEVEFLKRSLEEEAQARITGDALNGEACMQLQAVLQFEGQCPSGDVEEQLKRLSEEISDLRLGLEAEVLVRLQGDEKLEKRLLPLQSSSADSLHSLRIEIEHEARQRTIEFDRLRNSVTAAMHDTNSDAVTKHQELLERERSQRQTEDQSLHQLISTEASRLWEALHTHNHDVIIEGKTSHDVSSMKVQPLTKSAGLHSSVHPRRIQLNSNSSKCSTPRRAVTPPPLHTAPHSVMHA